MDFKSSAKENFIRLKLRVFGPAGPSLFAVFLEEPNTNTRLVKAIIQ